MNDILIFCVFSSKENCYWPVFFLPVPVEGGVFCLCPHFFLPLNKPDFFLPWGGRAGALLPGRMLLPGA